METVEPFINHLLEEIRMMIKRIFHFETLVKLTLVILILSMPPGRPQNYRLIHCDHVNLSFSYAHFLVENANEKIDNYKKKYSGIICTVRSFDLFFFKTLTYQKKTEAGFYKIIWTHFKTVKVFGIQERLISDPRAIKALDIYFFFYFKENENLFPMYCSVCIQILCFNLKQIGEAFKTIFEKYFNKKISISKYRMICTTIVSCFF